MNQLPVACFAPDLTKADLARYEELIKSVTNERLRYYLAKVWDCVKTWFDMPESTRASSAQFKILNQGREKSFSVIPLEDEQIADLDAVTPYPEECKLIGEVFAEIPNGELRNAAHHLLWHTIEIANDREPITLSKLV